MGMRPKTIYIVPKDDGWAVIREGDSEGRVKPYSRSYSTQKQALEAARGIVQRLSAGQIVLFGRDGSMRRRHAHGLPAVQTSPRKSDLGTQAIKKAVSTVIRERLLGK